MATEVSARKCECHGERMSWVRDPRYLAGGFWRCRIRERKNQRLRYERLNGLEFNHLLLMHRRHKALARRRKREEF